MQKKKVHRQAIAIIQAEDGGNLNLVSRVWERKKDLKYKNSKIKFHHGIN